MERTVSMKKNWKSKMLDIAIIVSVIIFAVCFAVLIHWYSESKNAEKEISELSSIVTTESKDEELADKKTKDIRYCVAWLEIPGTDIDYPVMQKPGNPEYYLRRNFKGEYSYSGTPFLDAGCSVSTSQNLIVYGHNMKDGTMFSGLMKFKDLNYCMEHQDIKLTVGGITNEYKLYAVCVVDSSDGWYTFKGQVSEDNFTELISHIKNTSSYISNTQQAVYGDNFLTLSTCDYSSDNSRLILIAKRS